MTTTGTTKTQMKEVVGQELGGKPNTSMLEKDNTLSTMSNTTGARQKTYQEQWQLTTTTKTTKITPFIATMSQTLIPFRGVPIHCLIFLCA